jgi:hypothetical protein
LPSNKEIGVFLAFIKSKKMERDPYKMMDYSSLFNFNKRLGELAREYEIAVQTQQIVGDRLAECFRVEGVNQFVNCRELALQYNELCNDRYHGMIFPPGTREELMNRKRIFTPK